MIREAREVTVSTDQAEVQASIARNLAEAGFRPARSEPGYLESRRGKVKFFRLVPRMSVEDTPVVVCVAISARDDGTQVTVGAYPDLGPGVIVGPLSRPKWRTAMSEAAELVIGATHSTGNLGQETETDATLAPAGNALSHSPDGQVQWAGNNGDDASANPVSQEPKGWMSRRWPVVAVAGGIAAVVSLAIATSYVGSSDPVATAQEEQAVDVSGGESVSALPTTYTGTGDEKLSIQTPEIFLVELEHPDDSDFSVHLVGPDSTGADSDTFMIVEGSGRYSGTILAEPLPGVADHSLDIRADGPWKVTVSEWSDAQTFDHKKSTKGSGDAVLVYYGPAGVASITHDGSRDFYVATVGDEYVPLVQEVGTYQGEQTFEEGPILVQIFADGNWSFKIDPDQGA